MKRTIRLTALLGLGFLLGACTEDDIIKNYGPRDCVGDEIVFGVSTASDFKTRTVYGDASASEKKVEVNWIPGDMLMIACPQAASTKLAHYQVTAEGTADSSQNKVNDYSVTKIERAEGEASSLQWGAGEGEDGLHDFFAVYPSFKKAGMSPTKNGDNPFVVMDSEGFSGYLPLDQSSNSVDEKVDEKGINYVVNPNMDIAYMVANTPDVVRGSDVELAFSSLNTVLQFQIHRGKIENNIGVDQGAVKIHGASLVSASGQALCGSFNYKFNGGACTSTEDNSADYSRVTISLPESKTLTEANYCDFTFFVLPTYQNTDNNDLQLQVMYSVGSSPQIKTATIKAGITAHRKHLFKNVKLPAITKAITGSNWFQGLANNILLSQVSIPVASNVFALEKINENTSTGFSASSCQQVKSFTELWDMGVRGFEIQTQKAVNNRNVSDGTLSLGTANFTCDEVRFNNSTYNFNYAFTTLVDKLRPIVDGKVSVSSECLIIICTYQASDDGYNPNDYVSQLINYLNAYLDTDHAKTRELTQSNFIQIKTGTTAGELKGNIAIVIRPGDDDRYQTNNYTSEISLGAWAGNLTLIQDWGTAFDVWDRRYEIVDAEGISQPVAREATFETKYVVGMAKKRTTARPQIETWLCGTSTSGSTYTQKNGCEDFGGGTAWPTKKATFKFDHAMTGRTGTAYVQEWARVVKDTILSKYSGTRTGVTKQFIVKYFDSNGYLWVTWPESLPEKKKAIADLFKLSVAEKGKSSDNLYINSLSGYYLDESVTNDAGAKVSLLPFKDEYKGSNNTEIDATGQGRGGDHVTLAYDLNKYVYGILSGNAPLPGPGSTSYLPEGPWGLVMMEHIGNTTNVDDKSVDLVNLIMMNNFKFPLSTSSDTTEPKTVAVSFTIDPADPSGAIH